MTSAAVFPSLVIAVGVVVGAAPGCVDKAPPAPAIDPALVADNLLTAPPAQLTKQLDIGIGGKVTYLGYTSDQTKLVPGEKVSITHYWRVDEAPGKNWRVFSHLVGDGADFVNVDQTDMRKGHPVERWTAGQIIRDPQTFILRKDWRSPTATLQVGIYKKGGRAITDRMTVTGPSRDNAAIVATFEVAVTASAEAVPGVAIVSKATAPVIVDGKATDAVWATAVSATMVTAEGGPDVKGATTAQLAWDDQYLYVFVSATDDDVASSFTTADEPIWKADVVELFIDADANGRGYVELQVSPRNITFDSWFAGGRGPAGDLSYSAAMQTAVVVRGTLDNRDDVDQGWDAEFAIPLAAVKGLDPAMAVRLPPQPGDAWRLNVVRVDYPRGGNPAAASWNRIRYSDFHSLDRMLTVQFADASGATTGATGGSPGPAGGSAPGSAPGGATDCSAGGAAVPTGKPPGGATAAGLGTAAEPASAARRTPPAPPATAVP